MKYFLAMEIKEILLFVTTWMKLEGIMVSEISQTEKDTYYVISYVESTKAELSSRVEWLPGWREKQGL